jgi:predicted nucleotidyltransferase
MHPQRWWYLSDLARHLGLRPSSLQRELSSLVAAGILRRKREGNRVYFQPDPDCPLFPELRGLMMKTVGLFDVLRQALAPFARSIRWAFVYGSAARSEERSSSDVDLMVIGQVGLADIAPALRKAEARLARPVNPSAYTPEEFISKLKAGNHFLQAVLKEKMVFILGQGDELAATIGEQARAKTRDKPSGA